MRIIWQLLRQELLALTFFPLQTVLVRWSRQREGLVAFLLTTVVILTVIVPTIWLMALLARESVTLYENTNELRYQMSAISFETSAITTGEPIDIDLSFDVLDLNSELELQLALEVVAEIGSDGGASARDLSVDFTLNDGGIIICGDGSL